MARFNCCLTSKFLFVSAIFSWVIFRSVSSRTIFSQRMDELRSLRHKRHDYGECEYEVLSELDTTISKYGQELFEIIVEGQQKGKIKMINCRTENALCGDTSAYRLGRERRCTQTYYKNSELVTLGITSNQPQQHLPIDVLPSGCHCLDPLAN